MARPMAAEEHHTKIYVTGNYAAAMSPSSPVSFEMGMLNVHRAHTYKAINFSYGFFGYLGEARYGNSTETPETGKPTDIPAFNKQIGGLGLKTSIGYHITSGNGNTDFRVINWENSIGTEMGSYTDFRKALFNNQVYEKLYVSDKNTVWTTGLSTEIIWHARKNVHIQHAFRVFFGFTPGLSSSFDRELPLSELGRSDNWVTNNARIANSFSYFLTVKRFSFSCEAAYNINTACKLSLGYAF